MSAVRAEIAVSPALLLTLVGCIDAELVELADCAIETDPTVGAWTEAYTPDVASACDRDTHPYAWAIYDARIDAVQGHVASLSFRKTAEDSEAEDGPSVDLTWWILQSDESWRDCADIQGDEVIANGGWDAGVTELFVGGVPIWATEDDWVDTLHGETVYLYLATDGRDEPGVRRWWQRLPLGFTKSCPERVAP